MTKYAIIDARNNARIHVGPLTSEEARAVLTGYLKPGDRVCEAADRTLYVGTIREGEPQPIAVRVEHLHSYKVAAAVAEAAEMQAARATIDRLELELDQARTRLAELASLPGTRRSREFL